MTETLTTEQVEEILALAAGFDPFVGDAPARREYLRLVDNPQTVSSLATELLALRKRVGELEGVLTSSNRIIETLPADHIERAKEAMRKEFRGSGRSWWVSHARFINWIEAVRAALPTPKEPS